MALPTEAHRDPSSLAVRAIGADVTTAWAEGCDGNFELVAEFKARGFERAEIAGGDRKIGGFSGNGGRADDEPIEIHRESAPFGVLAFAKHLQKARGGCRGYGFRPGPDALDDATHVDPSFVLGKRDGGGDFDRQETGFVIPTRHGKRKDNAPDTYATR